MEKLLQVDISNIIPTKKYFKSTTYVFSGMHGTSTESDTFLKANEKR